MVIGLNFEFIIIYYFFDFWWSNVCDRYGISKWFGVSEKDMLDVLPNINNFQPSENHLFSEAQMFKTTA